MFRMSESLVSVVLRMQYLQVRRKLNTAAQCHLRKNRRSPTLQSDQRVTGADPVPSTKWGLSAPCRSSAARCCGNRPCVGTSRTRPVIDRVPLSLDQNRAIPYAECASLCRKKDLGSVQGSRFCTCNKKRWPHSCPRWFMQTI